MSSPEITWILSYFLICGFILKSFLNMKNEIKLCHKIMGCHLIQEKVKDILLSWNKGNFRKIPRFLVNHKIPPNINHIHMLTNNTKTNSLPWRKQNKKEEIYHFSGLKRLRLAFYVIGSCQSLLGCIIHQCYKMEGKNNNSKHIWWHFELLNSSDLFINIL